MQRSVCTTVLAALMAMASPALVLAQASGYPNKPVKLLIAYPPGGITDIAGRAVAQKLSEEFGQPVVVENRAGAGGTIGATAAAKSPPDGYTLFIGTSATHGTNPSTYARLQYDPVKDFVPIASIASAPLVVVVHPSFPAKTIAELVAHAKANPGKVTYAVDWCGGIGSPHAGALQDNDRHGHPARAVQGKRARPHRLDGGTRRLDVRQHALRVPQVKAGKLKALGVTSAKRSPQARDLPTVAETVPGFDSASWVALYAPAGTPPDIAAKLNAAANRALKSPDLIAKFEAAGLEPAAGTPADLDKHMRAEIGKWEKVVKQVGLVPE